MPEYDMSIEEQIKLLVKEFRTFKESADTRFDSIEMTLQRLRESMEERFMSASKTNAEHAGLLKSVVVHIRRPADRVDKARRR
jgi:hypothetical protein